MLARHRPLIFLAAITCFVAACGGSRPPQATARVFLECLANGDVAEAKKHATEPTGKFLDFAASMGTIPKEPEFKFVFVSETIDGDAAVVRFKDKDGSDDEVDLLKVEGVWKVHIKHE